MNNAGTGVRSVLQAGRAAGIVLSAVAALSVQATAADKTAGTITVGERNWELVPSIQCGVYPGPMVAIAGHAAGNPDIEITIDYDPSSGFVEAKVTGGDENLNLSSRDDDLSVDVSGRTVSGHGSFRSGWGGGAGTDGSFKVEC